VPEEPSPHFDQLWCVFKIHRILSLTIPNQSENLVF
jgi:hypothetical protein